MNILRHPFFRKHLAKYPSYRCWYRGRWERWFMTDIGRPVWIYVESHRPLNWTPPKASGFPQREIYSFLGRILGTDEWENHHSTAMFINNLANSIEASAK